MNETPCKTIDIIIHKKPVWCYTLNYKTGQVKERVGTLPYIYYDGGVFFKDDNDKRKLDRARQPLTTLNYDESTWCVFIFTAVWSGLIGVVIFGIALYHIIGWCIAPNASAFMWIINQLGGVQ